MIECLLRREEEEEEASGNVGILMRLRPFRRPVLRPVRGNKGLAGKHGDDWLMHLVMNTPTSPGA
jgi:hypothetical protein